jgi:hypothetical protein
MTQPQRIAYARLTLDAVRQSTIEGAPAAPQEMVDRFAGAIATSCVNDYDDETYVTAATTLAYLTDKSYEPPLP